MKADIHRSAARLVVAASFAFLMVAAGAETPPKPWEPTVGQQGKDVIWVPTPDVMVEKMLDMARVTPADFVMDLGSGDGRNVIGAAKRGARALGVEYNNDLVEYARRRAEAAGVPGRALFTQGDMYAADVSQASVLALFLLPDNLRKLTSKFLDMKAGSRIVSNTYEIPGWTADASETVRDSCSAFCIVFLYTVPAKVAGTWQMQDGTLTLAQEFQRVSGTFEAAGVTLPVEDAKLDGAAIRFAVNGVEYTGRVNGSAMEGSAKGLSNTRPWRATRED
jgi:hypothetical protein